MALTGPSGSGKSSLLMVMGGLEQATGGTVQALGENLSAMNEDALARFRQGRMGIVFQSFHLIPTMTALENVATPLELAGMDDAFDQAQAALDLVGLGHRTGHYPAQMSGGEQQRVAIARATAPRPAIIFADQDAGEAHFGELLPEFGEEGFPVELAIGDDVELFLKAGGKIVFDIAGEEVFEEGRDEASLVFLSLIHI